MTTRSAAVGSRRYTRRHDRWFDNVDPNVGWMERANCAGKGTDAFYPSDGRLTQTAALLCLACPVSQACASYGASQTDGTWGGVSENARGLSYRAKAVAKRGATWRA